MSLTNVGLIAWVFLDDKHALRPGFLALEVFVTVMLVLEIIVRIVVMRKKFWHDCCNVFDFIVCLLCVGSFLYYVTGPSAGAEVEDLLAEVGLLLRNGLQCLRMLLWLRFTGNSRGRGEAFQLEVGDPELSEHDFGVDDEEALMLGGRPMSSKKNTPEKVRRGPEPSHVDSTNLPPTLAGRRPHNVAAKLADSSAFSARGAVSFTGEDTELEVAVTPTTRLRAGGALQ